MAANEETFIRIATATGNGSSSTLSFTNIPQNYTDLVVRGTLQTTDAASTFGRMRVNSDTGSNYIVQRMSTTGQGNFTGARAQTSNAFFIGEVPNSGSSYVTSHEINAFSYSDVTYLYPTFTWSAGSPINGQLWIFSCATWTALTAITQLDFYFDTGVPTANSRLSLYGILRA